MEILVPTCDQYIKYVEALQLSCRGLLDEYKFKLLGYQPPEFKLDDNWEFISMGIQRGPNYWGNDMIEFLKTYPHQYFIYGNDDCALTYFNPELLQGAIEKGTEKGVGRFGLTKDGQHRAADVIDYFNGHPIVKFWDTENYRISLCWSIFSKDFFLEFCKQDMDPWQFEKSSCGENSINTSNWKILSFTPDCVLDAAYFRARKVAEVVNYWDKGYFGHDLQGKMKAQVKQIIFS